MIKPDVIKPVLLFIACFPLLAQNTKTAPPPAANPKDVENFVRDIADDLTNKDSRGFLDHFDPKMPDYETLHYEVEGLIAQPEVTASIEIVTDTIVAGKSDAQQRDLELDWVLYVDTNSPRRKIVKITIEKQGKKWKIIALAPVDFFKSKL